jgi:hypothetical protein
MVAASSVTASCAAAHATAERSSLAPARTPPLPTQESGTARTTLRRTHASTRQSAVWGASVSGREWAKRGKVLAPARTAPSSIQESRTARTTLC